MLNSTKIILFLFLSCSTFLFGQKKCSVFNTKKDLVYNGKNYKAYLDSLAQIGYYTLKIDSIQQDSCFIFIDKGKQFQRIFVKTDKILNSPQLVFDKKKKQYFTEDLDGYIQHIQDSLLLNGHPFAKIKIEPKGFIDNNAVVQISISTEKTRKIDNIVFKGYEKFPPFVKSELLEMDLIYNEINVSKISNRLSELNFVTQTESPKVSFTQDSTTLYIYAKKIKQNFFDGLVGFGNDENGDFTFQGNVQVNLQNAFNRLERLKFHWQSGQEKSQQFDINMAFPSIFKSKIGFNTNLNLQKQDSTFVRLEWRNGISYNFSASHSISGNFNLASSTFIEEEEEEENAPNQDFTKSGFGLSYHFQDANLSQLKGNKTLFTITSGIWNRKQKGKEKEEQTEVIYQFMRQQKIYKSHYVFSSVFGKNLIQDGEILVNDNYLVGGFNSIRGFNQNSISTKSMNVLTLGYRFIPSNNILFELFSDTAIIDSKNGEDSNTFLSFGLGTQFRTRFGFFQLNYAVGKTNETPFDFSNGKIHIGIKNYF